MSSFWQRWVHANVEFLDAWFERAKRLFPGPPAYGVPIIFTTPTKETSMGEITVPSDSGALTGRLSFLDSEGHETTADDVPQWTSTDEAVATVTPSDDGLSASVEIGGPGASVIEARSMNDDGSEVVAQGTVTVQPGDAVIGSIEFEQPTEQPPAEGEPPPTEEPV